MSDLGRRQPGALYSLAHDCAGQVGRRKVLQAAAVLADRRAHTTEYHDFAIFAHLQPPRSRITYHVSVRAGARQQPLGQPRPKLLDGSVAGDCADVTTTQLDYF